MTSSETHSTGIRLPPIKQHSNPMRAVGYNTTVVPQLHIRSHVDNPVIGFFICLFAL